MDKNVVIMIAAIGVTIMIGISIAMTALYMIRHRSFADWFNLVAMLALVVLSWAIIYLIYVHSLQWIKTYS